MASESDKGSQPDRPPDSAPGPSGPSPAVIRGASSGRSRPGRSTRLARMLVAMLIVLFVGLLATAAWLLGTASGARAAFALATRASGETVSVSGVEGRLAGNLRIGQLDIEQTDRHLTLKDLRLDWSPRELFDRHLHVSLLRIGHIAIITKVDRKQEAARLPESIGLPLRLSIDRVQIDGGTLALGPVNLVELGEFAFDLDYDGARYLVGLDHLDLSSVTADQPVTQRFSGQATLSSTKPYALDGEFLSVTQASVRERLLGASGSIGLSGSLEEIRTAIDLAISQEQTLARAIGAVSLKPFSDRPLGNADLTLRGLDLSALKPNLPRTALDVRLTSGAAGSGNLLLTNSLAGTLDRQRLPLSELRSAFSQQDGQFRLEGIEANLGSSARPAGVVRGSGSYAGGAANLSLATHALDLQKLDSRLRPTRLAGNAGMRHADGRQELTLALTEPYNRNKLSLEARAALADTSLAIERAELRLGPGRATLSGKAALAGSQAFSVDGKIERLRLRDLGNFPQLPELDLSADFRLRGARVPRLQADLSFNIADSRLAGQTLEGQGEARLRADSIVIPKLALRAGANRLTIQGSLAERNSTLSFAVSAPRLDQLGPSFAGTFDARGEASGTLAAPHVTAQWSASKLRLPAALQVDAMQGKADMRFDRKKSFPLDSGTFETSMQGVRKGVQQAGSVNATMRFSPQPSAPLTIDLRALEVRSGQSRIDSLALMADGTTAQHRITLNVSEAKQKWSLRANGGLRDLARLPQWQGTVDSLDASGIFAARLLSPAPLSVSQKRLQLDRFRLDTGGGTISVEQFLREANGGASDSTSRIVTRGSIERLQVAQLLKFAAPAPPLSTDLLLDGEWNVSMGKTLEGTLRIVRREGDVVMRGGAPVALGLGRLEALASATGGRANLQLAVEGRQLGRIDLDAATSLGRQGDAGGIGIVPSAPLSGKARVDIPRLDWLGPLMSPTLLTEGRLRSAVTLGGTLNDPRFAGRVDGNGLRMLSTDSGADFRDGVLDSEFDGSRLLLKQLRFQSGGQLTIDGTMDFAGGKPAAQLAVNAERYALLNRSDRRLTVSGSSRIVLADSRATVTGSFRTDAGFIDIGRQDAPQLSDDVTIVGKEQKTGGGGLAAALDVRLNLGDGITLRGRGLNALLRGDMRLLSAGKEAPRAQGSLNIAKGTFTAYGRELAIELGILRFTGPINNPALDIVAMRRGQEVEAGVSVRGTVLAPRITLVSEPTVPDAEKLSWLVLGQGVNAAGDTDLGALQAAAASLLSDSAAAGIQSQLATAFGLDTLSVGRSQDSLQQRIVTLGKQLSSRLYVSYQQGLESTTSALLLRYTLTPRLSVEAEAGTRSVLSLFYNLSFD